MNCPDGEEIRGLASQVEEGEREKQGKRNRQRRDNGGAKTYQEKNQNDKHKNHAAKQISFNGVGGDADEIAAVIVGTDFHVGRQKCPVDLLGFSLDAFEDDLGLLAPTHQDDAFDCVIFLILLGLK